MTNRLLPALMLAIFSLPITAHAAGNYAECLLAELPKTQTDIVAYAALKLCQQEYPGGIDSVTYGSGRGWWFGYDTPEECELKKGARTQSKVAAKGIHLACRRLYGQ